MYKITIKVEGMMCGMCEAHVNNAIRNVWNVKSVSSSHTKKETAILSEAPLDEEKIKEVISAQGYTVGEIKTEPYQKKMIFDFFSKRN